MTDRPALFKLRRAAAAAVRDLTVLEAAEVEVRPHDFHDYYSHCKIMITSIHGRLGPHGAGGGRGGGADTRF